VVIVAGLVSIGLGSLLLRTYGVRVRVGRLLAVTPAVEIAEARALATAGVRRYVRVEGRLDADDPFPDEQARPLVFRRRRLEMHRGRGWAVLGERRAAVPFRVREGLDEIDVDVDALDEGLVTLVRESVGTAAEAAAAVSTATTAATPAVEGISGPPATEAPIAAPATLASLPPTTPVRLRVEQLSSVEHTTVLGVPVVLADGRVAISSGTGRPLVVSTLEQAEAMRVLAEGRRARPLAAAAALAAGLVLLTGGLLWGLVAGGLG
jgi:hypothetical protein